MQRGLIVLRGWNSQLLMPYLNFHFGSLGASAAHRLLPAFSIAVSISMTVVLLLTAVWESKSALFARPSPQWVRMWCGNLTGKPLGWV